MLNTRLRAAFTAVVAVACMAPTFRPHLSRFLLACILAAPLLVDSGWERGQPCGGCEGGAVRRGRISGGGCCALDLQLHTAHFDVSRAPRFCRPACTVLRLAGGHGLPPATASGDECTSRGVADDHAGGAQPEDGEAELTMRARGGDQGGATLRFTRGATVILPPGEVYGWVFLG